MLHLPSSRIRERMVSAQHGVWLERYSSPLPLWMIAKLPMNMIRAIHLGAATSLCAWLIRIDEKQVAAFGLRVQDDPQHPCLFYGPCQCTEQVEDLRTLLAMPTFHIQLHNELSVPVLNAECVVLPERARTLPLALLRSRICSAESKVKLRSRALDVVQAAIQTDSTSDPRIEAYSDQPLRFAWGEPLHCHFPGIGQVCVENADQGNELELLAFQLFEHMCPFGAYWQPQVKRNDRWRELCDVLAVSRVREHAEEGVFVVQSKVAAETVRMLSRTTERRASSIQKSILAAIVQLKGAIRSIKSGCTVYRANRSPIMLDAPLPELAGHVEPLDFCMRANKVGHGIILVSDMHADVNWTTVATELLTLTKSTQYFCQVLDLRELQLLVSRTAGRPAVLEALLVNRWEKMKQQRTALLRCRFVASRK